jgi:hypothetical protein
LSVISSQIIITVCVASISRFLCKEICGLQKWHGNKKMHFSVKIILIFEKKPDFDFSSAMTEATV